MWVLFWAVSGGAISILGFLSWRSWNNYQKYKSLRSLPSPKRNWLLGNAPELLKAARENRFNSLRTDWAKALGPIYVYWIGNKPTLILSQPKLITQTLTSGFKDKNLIRDPQQVNTWEAILGAPVMIQKDGEEWKWRRQTHNKNFDSASIKSYYEVVVKACLQVIDTCVNKSNNREIIEVDPLFSELTMRIICNLLLGIPLEPKTKSIEGPELEPGKLYRALSTLTNQFITRVINKNQLLNFLPTKKNQDYWAAKKYLKEFVESRVDLALKIARTEEEIDSSKISSAFKQSILVKLAKQPKFTKDMLCAEAIGVIFAGTDTTAHTLSFTVGALGIHSKVLQTARAEVDRVWDLNNGLSAESLKELSYIQAVIKESMRLYPVTNGGSGCIVQEILIIPDINFPIPSGTKIGWSIAMAGIDPDEYPNSEQFLPERWLKKDKDSLLPSFLFFGSGPHRCLGESLAFLEATVMLTMLIRHFDWEVVNGQDSLENLGQNLTVFPSDRMPIRFKAREFAERTVNVN